MEQFTYSCGHPALNSNDATFLCKECVVSKRRKKTRPNVDYVTTCIVLFEEDLTTLETLVHHARANGDRRANRSSIIRDALKRLLEFTARGGKWRSK